MAIKSSAVASCAAIIGTTFALTMIGSMTDAASADSISDDFEHPFVHQIGNFPGPPWFDTALRITPSTSPDPDVVIINTTDAFGQPTRAAQLVEASGSSAGIFAEIEGGDVLFFEGDVRIDQFSDAFGFSWPVAAGFLQDGPQADLNDNPQMLVYTLDPGQVWRIYINNGGVYDYALNSPVVTPGRWYHIELEVDTRTGGFDAKVWDIASGVMVGDHVQPSIANWNPSLAQYDAITMFDGDYNPAGATQFSVATYDNIGYEVVGVCASDINGDGSTDVSDLLAMLAAWGTCADCDEDLDNDGMVGVEDLLQLLAGWGSCA